MTKRCCICGKRFRTSRADRKTCGDEDCRYVQHLEYMSEYERKHRERQNERNREWMRAYRARQKEAEKARLEAINSFQGSGYADRQKQKSLALAGKIEVTL